MNRRTLGIGVINYAYYLAKNGVRYSDDSALGLTHRTFEAMQYYLLKASVNLAKEYGACPLFNQTVYSQGKLSIDTYKKDLGRRVQRAFALRLGKPARRHRQIRPAQLYPNRTHAV